MTFVWLSLVLSAALVFGGAVMATSRAIVLFRDLRRLGRGVGDELHRISVAAGHIERHLEAASRSGDALAAAVARLSRSRARLNVLLAALGEVRDSIGLVTAFVPRK